tara:strand:- start:284 stop:466 length:183 start_codon:yes stop_codon:yes gene_type:complete
MSWRDAVTKEQFIDCKVGNCYLRRCVNNIDDKCILPEITIVNTGGQAACRQFSTIKESDR